MKRYKKIVILLGVLAVCCVAAFLALNYQEEQEQIRNSEEIILQISSDSVQAFSWEYEEDGEEVSLAFHKTDGVWYYDEDEAFPVDEEMIADLLYQFEEFGVSFVIEEVEDFGQYGLEEPVASIRLSTEDQDYEILLGDYSTMDEQRYVSIGDGNVYLVQNDPLDYYSVTLDDMLKDDDTPSFDQVTSIQFAGEENYSIRYEEESTATYCPDDVYFAQIDGGSLPLDTAKVSSYLSHITALDLQDYVTYNATEEELAQYGLDDPELTVTVDYTTENEDGEEEAQTFVLHVSRSAEERTAEAEAEAEAEESAAAQDGQETAETAAEAETSDDETEESITAYVRVGDSQIVYQISADDYESLMAASYDSLRHAQVLTADFADIYQIDITLEDVSYTITTEESDDDEADNGRVYFYQGEEIDISNFQKAAEALEADRFTDETPTEREEIRFTVYLDNENYPQVQVQLYRYDGSYCLAVVDGEPFALVDRAGVVDLIEAVNTIVLN